MTILQTERLTLRPLRREDRDALFEIYQDEKVMHFLPTRVHQSANETIRKIEHDLSVEDAHYWAVCLKGTDTLIGEVMYLATRIRGMGYFIHSDHWGKGYVPEACRAVLDYGFAELGYDRVELWIDELNVPSLRVAQKLGFSPKGRIPLKDRYADHYHYLTVWGVLKSEWQNGVRGTSADVPFYAVEPVLHVHDITATTDYYRDTLGFHVDFLYGNPPTHAGVSRGEWSGNLVSLQLSQIPREREIVPSGHLHIRVGMGLDALYQQYSDKGVEIVEVPADKPWGFREFTIRDVNGHVLIFGRYL
ncbi:MAG: GNAT family N-acetyltransferase [Phototrophicaceae bacterium]